MDGEQVPEEMVEVKLQVDDEEGPPTYRSAQSDKPPDYDSLFGRVQQVKDDSDGNVDFAQKVVAMACCGTICTLISLLTLFTLPVVNMIIGLVYYKQCDIEQYIPIYLVVSGAVGIIKGILQSGLLVWRCKDRDTDDETPNKPNPLDQILNCFLFAWFIAGSVWVYRVHDKVQYESKGADDYCHEVCYLYAFWFLTITYIFMALGLVCCCGITIVGCLVACKDKK